MKQFNRIIILIAALGLMFILVTNLFMIHFAAYPNEKNYMIEVNRLYSYIKNRNQTKLMNSINKINNSRITHYRYVTSVSYLSKNLGRQRCEDFFSYSDLDRGKRFTILPLYEKYKLSGYVRFAYRINYQDRYFIILSADITLLLFLASLLVVLFYLRRQIIKPFHDIKDLPEELSKGHMNIELKESKNRYFGKFLWGLSMLKESIETQKGANLKLERERKILIASLSHDIKTPVASIKLYSKALEENLYSDEKRRIEALQLIERKADDIEKLVGEIIGTSASYINQVNIQPEEVYLSTLLKKVKSNYDERLSLLRVNFEIVPYKDKLVYVDMDRVLEVFDNIIENAIKYGDGEYIKIFCYEEDYCQLIEIENSGIPVPQNELPHIFSSFWRGSNSAGIKGNGLGLYFSKQIMKAIEGDIFAESREEAMAVTIVIKTI